MCAPHPDHRGFTSPLFVIPGKKSLPSNSHFRSTVLPLGAAKAEKVSVFKGLQHRLPIFRHVSCRKVFWSEFLWHSCFLRVCTKECFSFIFYSKYSVRTSEFHTSENVCTLNWRLLILIWKRSDLNFMMFLVLGEIGLKAKV